MGRRTLDRNAVEVLERLGYWFEEDLSGTEMGETRSSLRTASTPLADAYDSSGPAGPDSPPAGPDDDEENMR